MLVGGMPEAVATYTETGAYRYSCDLENFGTFGSLDGKKIDIVPLYAISNLFVQDALPRQMIEPEYQRLDFPLWYVDHQGYTWLKVDIGHS